MDETRETGTETTAIAPVPARALGALREAARKADDFARAAKAENTKRAYRSDWRDFSAWCAAHGLAPMPARPSTLRLYLADLAGRAKVATVRRRLASVSKAHQVAGHPSPATAPEVRETMAGIRRALGVAPTAKAAATVDLLRRMVADLGEDRASLRDRALLLLGFAGAFRRSELVALNVEDLARVREGLLVTLRRSKTDQEGKGTEKAIPYGSRPETCPVRALDAWREAAGIAEGPLFRAVSRHGRVSAERLSDRTVARTVKAAAAAAGLDARTFAGHSLRAGLATSAAEAGVSLHDIKRQTGHRSDAVASRYIRRASLWRGNAAAAVGL
jgi:integrase